MTDTWQAVLPADFERATLIGRIWDPVAGGPRPVAVFGDSVHDLTGVASTVSELLEMPDAAAVVRTFTHEPGDWSTSDVIDAALKRDTSRPHLIAPVDLQVVKACGVTFIDSLIERVIEEQIGGDPLLAAKVRDQITDVIGTGLADIQPGSPAAVAAKKVLQQQGLWSQYLEVGIGPDPEVFAKAPVLSSVGLGAGIGVTRASKWSNPEPELVLVVTSDGRPIGASLGNDVNLRDVEGRSALLLGKAKDNNASSAIGPFVRLFDNDFSIDDLRGESISLDVAGEDGFRLEGTSSLSRISRSFEELMGAVYGDHHQYPDGFALYTGTMFAPTLDRDEAGRGFTHKPGDVVRISNPRLGMLVNTVGVAEELPRWTFGVGDLIRHLGRLEPVRPGATSQGDSE